MFQELAKCTLWETNSLCIWRGLWCEKISTFLKFPLLNPPNLFWTSIPLECVMHFEIIYPGTPHFSLGRLSMERNILVLCLLTALWGKELFIHVPQAVTCSGDRAVLGSEQGVTKRNVILGDVDTCEVLALVCNFAVVRRSWWNCCTVSLVYGHKETYLVQKAKNVRLV